MQSWLQNSVASETFVVKVVISVAVSVIGRWSVVKVVVSVVVRVIVVAMKVWAIEGT